MSLNRELVEEPAVVAPALTITCSAIVTHPDGTVDDDEGQVPA